MIPPRMMLTGIILIILMRIPIIKMMIMPNEEIWRKRRIREEGGGHMSISIIIIK
jgi:hypothetical protein